MVSITIAAWVCHILEINGVRVKNSISGVTALAASIHVAPCATGRARSARRLLDDHGRACGGQLWLLFAVERAAAVMMRQGFLRFLTHEWSPTPGGSKDLLRPPILGPYQRV